MSTGANNIKAIIFDVDGTLIDFGDKKCEDSTIKAIEMAKEKGIKIIVATGRGFKYLHHDIKERVKPDYYISVNGGSFNDSRGNILDQETMSLEEAETIVKVCSENNYIFGFKFADSLQAYHRGKEFIDLYCESGAIIREEVDDNSDKKDYHLTKMLPIDAFIYSESKDAYHKLKEKLQDFQYHFYVNDYACECFPNHINKAKMLKRGADIMGIDLAECMCFGDGTNDVEMFKAVGLSVAMGNSKDNVKQQADYVTDAVNASGIYNALKHFEII